MEEERRYVIMRKNKESLYSFGEDGTGKQEFLFEQWFPVATKQKISHYQRTTIHAKYLMAFSRFSTIFLHHKGPYIKYVGGGARGFLWGPSNILGIY